MLRLYDKLTAQHERLPRAPTAAFRLVVPVCRFTGLVYRAHHPMWAYTPLSGEGALKYGGRFNWSGKSSLYTSLDPTTAWMEAQQGFPFKPQPMTLVAYQVDCAVIADLTDTNVQQIIGCPPAELGCAWEDLAGQNREPPTWQLADRHQAQGVAGLLVRSFATGCTESNRNLVQYDLHKGCPRIVFRTIRICQVI